VYFSSKQAHVIGSLFPVSPGAYPYALENKELFNPPHAAGICRLPKQHILNPGNIALTG
jgi:hypothetical protein